MVFYPPSWYPKLPELPDDVPISEFILNEAYGRFPLAKSHDPYTCGLSGRSYSANELKQRVDFLARSLLKEFGWTANEGKGLDKTVCVFSLNTIDSMTINWAIHRANGISSPANAAYTAFELEHQLKNSESKAIFTCVPLLPVAREACAKAGIPERHIYIVDLPRQFVGNEGVPPGLKTVEQLIQDGSKLPEAEPLRWERGRASRQVAFLCYSSGTSGLPKGVMISHYNVIANTIQHTLAEKPHRDKLGPARHVAMGVLPFSHIYALVPICHSSTYRGEQIVVLPKFELKPYLDAVARFHVSILYVVPPIIISMIKNKSLCDKYDLSSVIAVYTGAAPLGAETAHEVQKQYPKWRIRQAYGSSEASPMIAEQTELDLWFGSIGHLAPGLEARLVSMEGNDITGYDQPGELLVKGPNITLGYLKNEEATRETYVEDGKGGRWLRTGDEVMVKKAANGEEHLFITDRIKELIKVKGFQVAPAELEAHLLTHPAVADCTVVGIPDDEAGEIPKAYVVKDKSIGLEDHDRIVKRNIQRHVEKDKARHKWLKGGVEFIDAIPKNPSGKILRRVLREKEKAERARKGPKL